MRPEAITLSPPRPVRPTLMTQSWRHITFLHWRVDPDVVRPLLPLGTEPDVFDGAAHVGLVAFRVTWVRMGTGPLLPFGNSFDEINVRTYAVDGLGRRSVVFLSLDVSAPLAVLAARLGLRLPFFLAELSVDTRGNTVTYRCRRRWPGRDAPRSATSVRVGSVLREPTELDRFLTARWGMHFSWCGHTVHLGNTHPSWSLHRAELLELTDELVAAAGLPVLGTAPVSVRYASGTTARFGPVPTARRDPRARVTASPGRS